VFAVDAHCVHSNRIDHEDLVELAAAQVLGALHSPVPVSPSWNHRGEKEACKMP
jgi:hypothetical protein